MVMRIIYNKVSPEYVYPLSKDDINKAKGIVPAGDLAKLRTIEFGCNNKTTQEGRIVQRGRFYDIRINFCLNNCTSLILSDDRPYIEQIERYGGLIDHKARLITWKLADAKRYALFLLFHEIGHLVYAEHHLGGTLERRTSKNEEIWCDTYAAKKTREYCAASNC